MTSDSFVQVPPNSTGLKVRTVEVTRADGTIVEEQVVVIGDPNQPLATVPVDMFKGLGIKILDGGELTNFLQDILLELRAIRIGIGFLSKEDLSPRRLGLRGRT